VGISTGDDAAVYRLGEDLALVQTVDFFTPIVDNPYDYGTIAVANALSDVYAMGGKPLIALNIVGFPVELPIEILGQVLKGGADKAREAGVLIVGGHTIDDPEPKYGLAVTGIIKPGSQVTNAGAQEGDDLILTKPLGTGVITTAAKNEGASEEIVRRAIEVMNTLNKTASEVMVRVGVHACTDVTGFGLIGHLLGMTKGSKVGARLYFSEIPFIQGVRELVKAGYVSGGTSRNLEYSAEWVRWSEQISSEDQILMCDAQTSGGLLIAVDRNRSSRLLEELHGAGVLEAKVIGEVVASTKSSIEVMP
jgi:selenide,water dikinase